ncbi:HEAT repeat domain-containing protein [Pirellulales bacterium]|nr:HEAT repeat domain-containing protein [Pirellulales bacterium]
MRRSHRVELRFAHLFRASDEQVESEGTMTFRTIVGSCLALFLSLATTDVPVAAQETLDLDVAVRRGLVSVDVESLGGATGNRVKVRVQRKTDKQLNLTVQSGTTFAPQGADVQGLAIVKLVGKYIPGNRYHRCPTMVLVDNQSHAYLMQSVCVDYHKSSPRQGQRYALAGVDVRCQRIFSAPQIDGATIWSHQSAVWIDRVGVPTSDLQRKFHVKTVDIRAAQSMIQHAEQVGAESLAEVDVSVDVRNQVRGLFSSNPQVRVAAYQNFQRLSDEDRRKFQLLADGNVPRGAELPTANELLAGSTLESLMPAGLELPKLQIPESIEELATLLQSIPGRDDDDDDEARRFPRARLLPLMVGLRARRPAIRALAVRKVAQIDDPWAIDTLIVVLSDSSEHVRKAAIDGLQDRTDQDFGDDRQAWLEWWEQAQDNPETATAPSAS